MTSNPDREILTVGHSTHPMEHFVGLLAKYSVTAVADVRSAPYSRFNPQFNRESLEKCLKQAGIAYVFLGKELGARSDDPSCYDGGRVRYDRLAKTAAFQSGIERVIKGAQTHRIALMCAEKDPLECHRTLLVSRELEGRGFPIRHILADGGSETQAEAMTRLLKVAGLPETDLFRSKEELVVEAAAIQEGRIAYVDENQQMAGEGAG